MIRERNSHIGEIPRSTIISTVDKFCMIDENGNRSVLVKDFLYDDMTYYIQYDDEESVHIWACHKNETFKILRKGVKAYRVDNISVLFDVEYDKLV